jgi:hypothetical protein
MDTISFLEYLHEHDATRALADQLAEILVAKGRLPAGAVPLTETSRLAG